MRKIAAFVGGIIFIGGLMLIADRSGPLREGDVAPGFTARVSTGGTITLGDFRGKKNVVLFFYPKDFTSGCTKEACAYRDNFGEITKLDAVMFGISYDSDSTHASFISRYRLPYPLISDVNQTISRAYGTARFGGRSGSQRRVTYVIDKQGIIRRVSHHEIFIDRHVEDVVQALKNLAVESMKEKDR